MKIVYESSSNVSLTTIDDNEDRHVGCSVGDLNDGIQPTYGMTADSMGFNSFAMTINLKGKS